MMAMGIVYGWELNPQYTVRKSTGGLLCNLLDDYGTMCCERAHVVAHVFRYDSGDSACDIRRTCWKHFVEIVRNYREAMS